jgi:hypothetical protein
VPELPDELVLPMFGQWCDGVLELPELELPEEEPEPELALEPDVVEPDVAEAVVRTEAACVPVPDDAPATVAAPPTSAPRPRPRLAAPAATPAAIRGRFNPISVSFHSLPVPWHRVGERDLRPPVGGPPTRQVKDRAIRARPEPAWESLRRR